MLSTLFHLLLANRPIFMCFFFLSRVVLKSFFTSPVDNENVGLRLALAIPTCVPITVANDARETLPLVADKTIKNLSK